MSFVLHKKTETVDNLNFDSGPSLLNYSGNLSELNI
jgi:hypothetical protein